MYGHDGVGAERARVAARSGRGRAVAERRSGCCCAAARSTRRPRQPSTSAAGASPASGQPPTRRTRLGAVDASASARDEAQLPRAAHERVHREPAGRPRRRRRGRSRGGADGGSRREPVRLRGGRGDPEAAVLVILDPHVEERHGGAVRRPALRRRRSRPTARAARSQPRSSSERARRRRVADARVERRVADEAALGGVVGAVVDEADDAVVAACPRRSSRPSGRSRERVAALDRQRLGGGGPHRVVGRKRDADESLDRPVGRAGAGVGLRERAPLVVPAHREEAVVVRDAVLGEVADDAARRRGAAGPSDSEGTSAIAPIQNGAAAAKR